MTKNENISVPAVSASMCLNLMLFSQASLRGVLNFAPVTLHVGLDVSISSVDLGVHLEQLSFQAAAGPDRNTTRPDACRIHA